MLGEKLLADPTERGGLQRARHPRLQHRGCSQGDENANNREHKHTTSQAFAASGLPSLKGDPRAEQYSVPSCERGSVRQSAQPGTIPALWPFAILGCRDSYNNEAVPIRPMTVRATPDGRVSGAGLSAKRTSTTDDYRNVAPSKDRSTIQSARLLGIRCYHFCRALRGTPVIRLCLSFCAQGRSAIRSVSEVRAAKRDEMNKRIGAEVDIRSSSDAGAGIALRVRAMVSSCAAVPEGGR